jgi:hypothetical protein
MQRYTVTRVLGSTYAARYGGMPLRVYNSATSSGTGFRAGMSVPTDEHGLL